MRGRAVLVLVLVLVAVLAVDMKKFKNCDESSFCKRNRKISTAQIDKGYTWHPASLVDHDYAIQIEIRHPDMDDVISLVIRGYGDDTIRFKALEGKRERYQADELLLLDKMVPVAWKDIGEGRFGLGEHIVLEYVQGDRKIVLYKDSIIWAIFNERNLYNMEWKMEKPAVEEKPEESVAAEEEPVEEEEEPVEEEEQPKEEGYQDQLNIGLFEESFDGHQDTKPAGPASIGLDVTFVGTHHLYGLPEHGDRLHLRNTVGGEPYRLYNLDVFEYDIDSTMALYGTVPLIWAHGGSPIHTMAMLWLNPSETWVDISAGAQGKEAHWMSESGAMDFIVFMGPTPQDIYRQYTAITGRGHMPQLFSLGYHQCRWNYRDVDDVIAVDEQLDAHDIPYDVIWLDIEHTDQKKYFTWHPIHFKDPERMTKHVGQKGRKIVTIVDPHIKTDENYYVHREALEGGHYLRNKNGDRFEGHCWPGQSSYPDFLNPQVREWWATLYGFNRYEHSTPIVYTWNDMNEASVFNGPEMTFEKDMKHHNGWENRDVHNIYGMMYHRATHLGHMLRHPDHNDRPFILTRSFFAGTQNYGAVWTGDNKARWDHLDHAFPMLASMGLGGIPQVGADVGGFFGHPDDELHVRWFQSGAFYPFMRQHAHIDSPRREPYLLKEEYLNIIRKYIRIRYQLIPHLYTLFNQFYREGVPPLRPLFVEFPTDPKVFEMDTSVMFGSELLVHAVAEEKANQATVYLPGDSWYNYHTFAPVKGGVKEVSLTLEDIPIFLRGGRILMRRDRARRSTSAMMNDPYTMIVAPDSKGYAKGELYIDDGHSFDYERGDYQLLSYEYENNEIVSKTTVVGKYANKNVVERIVVLGVGKAPTSIHSSCSDEFVSYTYDKENAALTIRKPDCPVNSSWRISLKY